MSGFGIEDFRFSGSYVTRYHHCHGSAVLEESIPGFKSNGVERAASTLGTRLHKVFERILAECNDILEAAALLNRLADVWGKDRLMLLQVEKSYIVWWFMKEFEAPPIDFSIIELLHDVVPAYVEEDIETGTTISHLAKEIVTPPKMIRFLADALRFIMELHDETGGSEMYLESKRIAEWTQTKPKTSADVAMSNSIRLDIVDLKTGTIPVEAAHNEQLLYYVESYRDKEVELWVHIVQPGGISSWQVPREYLDEWVASVLRAEQAILAGDRSLTPGKHCQFCPANPYTKGERGTPNCPAQVEVLFGAEDLTIILEEE